MKRDTQRKAVEILQAIESLLQKKQEVLDSEVQLRPVIGFDPDCWGDNNWTVWSGDSHTHVGVPGGSFENLVDNLHSLLCERRGLSWV
jgi:hypothetical protein